jgi:hypothetical protein
MATVTVTSTPVTLDTAGAAELGVTNTGGVTVFVNSQRVRPGQRLVFDARQPLAVVTQGGAGTSTVDTDVASPVRVASGGAAGSVGVNYWPGLGMNLGSTFNFTAAYPSAQVVADLAYLKACGFTAIRVAMPDYADAGGVANMRRLALDAKAAGFYVSYGVTAAGTMNATTFNGAYQTAVYAEAAWARTNRIDEFHVGNEIENHIDNTTVTQADVRAWCRAAATAVKNAGYTGVVSYCVPQGFTTKSAAWAADAAAGLGGLDLLGLNVYGDDYLDSNQNFSYYLSQLVNAYPPGKVYVSEFNMWYTWNPPLTDAEISAQVLSRLAVVKGLVSRAMFFAWRFANDGFSAQRADGQKAPFWFPLAGLSPAAPPYPTRLRSTQHSLNGVLTGTNATRTANTLYVGAIEVGTPRVLTGLSWYNGGTLAGDIIGGIWSADGQTLLASIAATTQAGTFGIQRAAFATVNGARAANGGLIVPAGQYWVGLEPSASTATFALIASLGASASMLQGAFALPATFTPPAANATGSFLIQASTY